MIILRSSDGWMAVMHCYDSWRAAEEDGDDDEVCVCRPKWMFGCTVVTGAG